MLEKDVQPTEAQPTEREIMRGFRKTVRVARVVLLTAAGLLAARFALQALGFDEGLQPLRLLLKVTFPLAAPVLEQWPEVPRLGTSEIEFQSLIAATACLVIAHLLTRWSRRRRRS